MNVFRMKPVVIDGKQQYMIEELIHSFFIWYRWRDYFPLTGDKSIGEPFIGSKDEALSVISHLQNTKCF